MISWPAKPSGADAIYAFDLSDFLAEGETIVGTPSIVAVGVSAGAATVNGSLVEVEVSGGTDGTVARVTATIVTSNGTTWPVLALLPIGEEPVNLTEAKAQCRMSEDDSDDDFIQELIPQARAFVEKIATVSLMPGTREVTFDKWGDFLEVYFRPVLSIETVAYVDADGNDAEYAAFLAPLGRFPLRIFPAVNDSFPALARGGLVTVTATVGSIDPALPEYLVAKRAILLLIGHWFEFREAVVEQRVAPEIAFAVTSLIDSVRPVSAY